MLEILQFPFMQRALIAGITLGVVLAYLGVFVILRRMAFFSDGIAHASLAGVAIGVLVGFAPLYMALIVAVVFAAAIFLLERTTTLASDAIIGILFTGGMAGGVLMMSLQPGYQPELMSFLFGNILAVSQADLIAIVALSLAILGFLAASQRKLMLLSLDADYAYLSGVRPIVYQLSLYIVLAVAVVLGIKVAGVVLVSALLIIPVSTAKLIVRSLGGLISLTVGISVVTVLSGMLISYVRDLPMGPTIVLSGVVVFLSVFVATIASGRSRG